MANTTILLAKINTEDTNEGIVKNLKQATVTVPSNVIDCVYFRQAVQFHIFHVAMSNIDVEIKQINQDMNKLTKENKTTSNAYLKKQDKRNELLLLERLLSLEYETLEQELNEEYEDIKQVKATFLQDNFAKTYAWVLSGAKSRKVWKSGNEAGKGKVEEIKFMFKDESKIIALLKDFDFSTTQEQKKASAKQIELFANELFGTNGGDIYKNISYKFSPEKINRELYTRFKKSYTHDYKGYIKDEENTPFDMCKQLYFMCLIQLKVPTINGQKIIKVEEVDTCNALLSVSHKNKNNSNKEKEN